MNSKFRSKRNFRSDPIGIFFLKFPLKKKKKFMSSKRIFCLISENKSTWNFFLFFVKEELYSLECESLRRSSFFFSKRNEKIFSPEKNSWIPLISELLFVFFFHAENNLINGSRRVLKFWKKKKKFRFYYIWYIMRQMRYDYIC